MLRTTLVFAIGFGISIPAEAGVIAIANFTPESVTVTITEAEHKPRTVTLTKAQVAPVIVAGPVALTFPAKPENVTLRLDPYHAYVLLPDAKAGRRLEGIEMPGDPLERDARPEIDPTPKEPVKIPVTLLVDDADPRAEKLWQESIRKRFDEAAAVVEAHAGVKLEFAGFDTWKSEPRLEDVQDALDEFTTKVKMKPGTLAIGYTSRIKSDEKEKFAVPFGKTPPLPTRHILLREWAPKAEAERVEVLIHHLGLALGAVPTDDPGSVMRARVANGLAIHPEYRFRFDPLNVLAMNIWAEELRRGPLGSIAEASGPNKARLTRVYKALLKTRPGESITLGYLNAFDRNVAANPDPMKPPAAAVKKDPPPNPTARDEVARQVIRAITDRARENAGTSALKGDGLMLAYVKAAATAALREQGLSADQYERVSGFMLGLGVALDDQDVLWTDPHTADAARLVESDADHAERLKVLGAPTLRGRRDLCRRFAVGCGMGEVLTANRAEEQAIQRSFSKAALARKSGVSLPALAAELAGIAFAQTDRTTLDPLRRFAAMSAVADLLPNTHGLRDGIAVERFKDEYGDFASAKFAAVLADVRSRVRKTYPGK